MPPTVDNSAAGEKTRSVGIIYPPPDLRTIIDKTALFVGKNGPDFETRLRASEQGNKKFNFLHEKDPYHAYYEFKKNEAAQGEQDGSGSGSAVDAAGAANASKATASATATSSDTSAPQGGTATGESSTVVVSAGATKNRERKEATRPDPVLYTVTPPPNTSAEDIDIIKLTAQFTAANGKRFLMGLAQREARNPLFDFLRPMHPLFPYFTALSDAYEKILRPPAELQKKLEADAENRNAILDRVINRMEWELKIEEEERAKHPATDAERNAHALIDWHDFTIVGTLEFDGGEAFPAPMAEKDFLAMMNQQKKAEEIEDKYVAPMPERVDDGGDGEAPPLPDTDMDDDLPPVPVDEPEEEAKIVPDYEPELPGSSGPQSDVAFEVNGQMVSADRMQEHMRIEMLHPEWKEQRERYDEKTRETTLASGDEIGANIRRLAKTREGIEHGSAAADDDKKPGMANTEKVQWDGSATSIAHVRALAEKSKAAQMPEIAQERRRQHIESRRQAINPDIGPKAPAALVRGGAPGGRPGSRAPAEKPSAPPPRSGPGAPRPAGGPPPPSAAPASAPAPPPASAPGAAAAAGAPPGQAQRGPMMNPARAAMLSRAPHPPPPRRPGPPRGPPGAAPHPPPAAAPPPAPMLEQRAQELLQISTGSLPPAAEPAAKRARTGASATPSLTPAEEFAKKCPPSYTISVAIPNDPQRASWNFNGQNETVEVSATTTFADVKRQLKERLGGMPMNKQKLQVAGHGFAGDRASLASLNIGAGGTITLVPKERGGRNK